MTDTILREQILALNSKDYPYFIAKFEGDTIFRVMINPHEIDEQMQFTLIHLGYRLELEGNELFLAELKTGDVYQLKAIPLVAATGLWAKLDYYTQLVGSEN